MPERPDVGSEVLYRNGSEYWPARVFDLHADPDFEGAIERGQPLWEGAVHLKVELPDGRIANRTHVPPGDIDGGWIQKGERKHGRTAADERRDEPELVDGDSEHGADAEPAAAKSRRQRA